MGDFDCAKMRNICILAHVDHGKTTLADHLIASSSAPGGARLLNPKQAGRVRFMDYLDEEQRRAITMKSSSIALRYNDHYSINLMDSPGHIDFCSEVSTAVRLSDGALVLVDAVEGVHIQTEAVLRQAWTEKLTPCLVLNKIDRLMTELKLTPAEAYTRLLNIVREANAIVAAYRSEKYFSDVDSMSVLEGPTTACRDDEDEYDGEDVFQPQKGNVAFVCALDGWGFTVKEFAKFYASKLGANVVALEKALWGPWYFHPETKTVVGKKKMERLCSGKPAMVRPVFVQFVLEPLWQVYQAAGLESPSSKQGGGNNNGGLLDLQQLWQVYQAASLEPPPSKQGGGNNNGGLLELQKIIKSFNLSIPPRELQNKDPKFVLRSVMSRWLPLSEAILSMVVNCMPDPATAQSFRITRLLPKQQLEGFPEAEMVRKSVEACDSRPEAPFVAFVSKMFPVPFHMLPERGLHGHVLKDDIDGGGGNGSDECFLAFVRIFSGVVTLKQRVYVLSALHDPRKQEGSMQKQHVQQAEIKSLYLMMGQGLEPVASAKAGNVVAIRGLGQHILKSATLSSTKKCWPFSRMDFQVSPALRVAIEPSDPADMDAVAKGLRLLNRADPFVEVTESSRGELVLGAAGEVHLERCVRDLGERFAKVSLEVSPPLVSYKETIEGGAPDSQEHLKLLGGCLDYVEKTTPDGRCVVRVQVAKLPPELTKVLEQSNELLGDIMGGKPEMVGVGMSVSEDSYAVEALKKRILAAVETSMRDESCKDRAEKNKTLWFQFLSRIWALGPRGVGPNILLVPEIIGDSTGSSALVRASPQVSDRLGFSIGSGNESTSPATPSGTSQSNAVDRESLGNSVVSGFQLATGSGPLCEEPMRGLAFIVEAHVSSLPGQPGSDESESQPQRRAFTGQVIAAVKDACRAAVLQRKPRLVESMYFCELNTPGKFLGPAYGVLHRRRAIDKKEKQQSFSLFKTVHAYVPVAESIGFVDELRRETSGACSALLVLSHWEELSEDPFSVPDADGSRCLPNTARKLIDSVRRRKGLRVEENVVQHATKQRTLARKV